MNKVVGMAQRNKATSGRQTMASSIEKLNKGGSFKGKSGNFLGTRSTLTKTLCSPTTQGTRLSVGSKKKSAQETSDRSLKTQFTANALGPVQVNHF